MLGRFGFVVRIAPLALIFMLVLGISPALAARDRTPPTAPRLSVTAVGPTHVSLSWTASTDNSPYIFYQVSINGNPVGGASSNRSITLQGLTPNTTYVFTVRARDNGINWSQPSNAVTVRTPAPSSGDNTPPTTPTNLYGFDGGCGEAWLSWTQSTDNVDPQVAIRYEFYVNGVYRPESQVYGRGSTVVYAVVEGTNRIEVFAYDSRGNRSAAATVTMQLFGLCQ